MRWNYKTDVLVLIMLSFGFPLIFLFIVAITLDILQKPVGPLPFIVLIILIGWLVYILKWGKKKSGKPKTEKKNE